LIIYVFQVKLQYVLMMRCKFLLSMEDIVEFISREYFSIYQHFLPFLACPTMMFS